MLTVFELQGFLAYSVCTAGFPCLQCLYCRVSFLTVFVLQGFLAYSVCRVSLLTVFVLQGLLRPGDIILEANGTRVTDPEQVILGRILSHQNCQFKKELLILEKNKK